METKFVKQLDIAGNGVLTEVTLLKVVEHGRDAEGNDQYELWFIKNEELDAIDQKRLLNVLQRSAKVNDFQPLFETMAQVTLGNGQNALDYFHQYVRIRYPSGAIERPRIGRSGGVVATGSEYA
jgi:hypothetical protein